MNAQPTSTRPARTTPRLERRRLVRHRAAVVAATAVVVAVIWGIARLLDIELKPPEMGGEASAAIGLGRALVAATVACLAGWGFLELLERRWPSRASLVWVGVASVVLVGSLGAPLTGAGITAPTRLVLTALHVGVAAVVATGLLGTSPRQRRNRAT